MKNVIITGASGMIGNIVLQNCLNSSEVRKVTSLVRNHSKVVHSKLEEILIDDFKNYKQHEEHFINQDIAYYCIGVYTGQVNREEFKKITVDYTQAFGTLLQIKSPRCVICFLSGQGADQSGQSKMMFAKDKGAAEKYLLKCAFPHTYIFRPGYIYPVVKRKEPNFFL